MSQKCQQRAWEDLFDDLVGAREQQYLQSYAQEALREAEFATVPARQGTEMDKVNRINAFVRTRSLES